MTHGPRSSSAAHLLELRDLELPAPGQSVSRDRRRLADHRLCPAAVCRRQIGGPITQWRVGSGTQ